MKLGSCSDLNIDSRNLKLVHGNLHQMTAKYKLPAVFLATDSCWETYIMQVSLGNVTSLHKIHIKLTVNHHSQDFGLCFDSPFALTNLKTLEDIASFYI